LITDELKDKYSLNKKEAFNFVLEELRKKYELSRTETIEILEEKRNEIPVTIFSKKLGALESLAKYMKENLGMTYHEIAQVTARNDRTIWASYKKALEKQKAPIEIKETTIYIPVSILNNRKLTILEAVIVYLKKKGLRYSEIIARLLDREQRNVWTIYSRAVKKLAKKGL